MIDSGKPAYLFSGFLRLSERPSNRKGTPMVFVVQVSMEVPLFEVDRRFWFDSHFEGETLLNESVTISLAEKDGEPVVKYGFARERGIGEANHSADVDVDAQGVIRVRIPLGFKENARVKPRPGFRGYLELTAGRWNK
jgi:hypothetical protein